mmetsp:Transcript_23401/g.55265  ORF Transcript_23401/g.55265 Transcript_23401/m.55265 type:complete len:210 (+) Transcript_23401:1517-2146(+)
MDSPWISTTCQPTRTSSPSTSTGDTRRMAITANKSSMLKTDSTPRCAGSLQRSASSNARTNSTTLRITRWVCTTTTVPNSSRALTPPRFYVPSLPPSTSSIQRRSATKKSCPATRLTPFVFVLQMFCTAKECPTRTYRSACGGKAPRSSTIYGTLYTLPTNTTRSWASLPTTSPISPIVPVGPSTASVFPNRRTPLGPSPQQRPPKVIT